MEERSFNIQAVAGGPPEYPGGDDPQAEGVEHGGQHFGAVVAESAFDGGRKVGNPHGEEDQADGGGVGEHMGGVGQEGETSGEEAGDDFYSHVARNQ